MSSIRSIVAYSTNTWISPVASLRVASPLKAAGITLIKGSEGDQVNPGLVSSADLVLIQRDFPRRIFEYKAILKRAHNEGKPVVLDLDDLLLLLPDDHPDRMSGYYDGALMPLARALVEVDAITTTNLVLKDYLSQYNPSTYLLPNYLDDRLWSFHPFATPKEKVTIGYIGSPSHRSDLEMVAPALEQILRDYSGRVKLHLMGTEPPTLLASLPGVFFENASTYEYSVFAKTIPRFSFDIAIAPLRNILFNQCKSAIKFLEYSAAGFPGIYSQVAPFQEVIQSGYNGLFAGSLKDWEENLRLLIESPQLRLQLATAAQDTVKSKWLLSDHAHLWQETYEQILAEHGQLKEMSPIARTILSITADADKQTQEYREIQTEQQHNLIKLNKAENTLKEIYSSRAWRFVQYLWAIKVKLFPPKREGVVQTPGPKSPLHQFHSLGKTQNISIDLKTLRSSKNPDKFDLIVFPVMDWETRTQRPQQLSSRFADRGHRVLYIRTSFGGDQPTQIRRLGDNLSELRLPGPVDLNLYQENMPGSLQASLKEEFSRIKDDIGIEHAITLVDLPFWTPLALDLRSLFHWPVVYDCMDYHKGFSTNATVMLNQEGILASQSDLVLASSHFLLREMSLLNSNCILVPNGADNELFGSQQDEVPSDLPGLDHIIIGFYGAIADWFDTSLVATLARSRPGWQFVLIGDTLYANITPFKNLSNVHLLGEKPYADLPKYLHHFDVAIIPFKKSPLTDAMNTVKLFEYLSAGKPVVATDLDETRHYSDYVYLAANQDEWLAALDTALQENSPEEVRSRRDFAAQNTWEQRVDCIAAAIQKLLVLSPD